MIRGIYDVDCSTWSPEGKLFQINYAKEAVKQGALCLALRSKTHSVICAVKNFPNELANHIEKTFRIDSHVGLGISGIVADARVLCKYMRRECRTHRNTFANQIPPKRLIEKVAAKAQKKTYTYGKRPFGVGMLVIYHQQDGPHIWEINPAGECFEYNAYSIGALAQSARTYFEKNIAIFPNATKEQLILHGLKALVSGNRDEVEMNQRNVEICSVGPEGFEKFEGDAINQFVEKSKTFDPSNVMQEEG